MTPQSPSPRGVHGNLTYDPDREVVVLFGGGTQPSQPILSDVWEYDGTTWTEVDMGSGPAARVATCFEYGGPGVGAVLFGGGDWDPYFDDTWSWDGTQWMDVAPASAPSARQSQMCAYDSFRDRIVLFGGGLNPTPLENDVWEFNGVDWSEVTAPGGPPGQLLSRLRRNARGPPRDRHAQRRADLALRSVTLCRVTRGRRPRCEPTRCWFRGPSRVEGATNAKGELTVELAPGTWQLGIDDDGWYRTEVEVPRQPKATLEPIDLTHAGWWLPSITG